MLFAIKFAAFTDTRDDDERTSLGKPDEEFLDFRTQGIGADQCALGF
jgi:hypothetical protein